MAFITVQVLLVGFNLFCRAIAKWLIPRLGFGSLLNVTTMDDSLPTDDNLTAVINLTIVGILTANCD